uniref:Uncharacterized protein n=1 Tax=Anopheles dirus TaxID=7168 RepID=A0A182ND89_9DIPT
PYEIQVPRQSASVSVTSNEEPQASDERFDDKNESNIPLRTNSIFNYIHKPINSETKRQLDRILLEFISKECLPFSVVESQSFKKFLHMLNPNYTVPSRKIVSNVLLPSAYNEEMENEEENLASVNAIALTPDGWSNTNNNVLNLLDRIRDFKLHHG